MGENSENSLFDNLLYATDNIRDITFQRYATVTKVKSGKCKVKEFESTLTHENVPILNSDVVELKKGDKVVLIFMNNSLYDPIVLGKIG